MGVWSAKILTTSQIQYAAADAASSLDVYLRLAMMPDYSRRLLPPERITGTKVHIVPGHGNVTIMNSRAAVGILTHSEGDWVNPIKHSTPPQLRRSQHKVLVTITEVLAPSLVIPGLKKKDKTQVSRGFLAERILHCSLTCYHDSTIHTRYFTQQYIFECFFHHRFDH